MRQRVPHTPFYYLKGNSTNMRKDKQDNDDAYTKTQYLHLTRKRCRKDAEVQETNVYATDSRRFALRAGIGP